MEGLGMLGIGLLGMIVSFIIGIMVASMVLNEVHAEELERLMLRIEEKKKNRD